MLTTKEIANLLPEEYDHGCLVKAILNNKHTTAFGRIRRVDSEMVDGKIARVYHLTLPQAIFLITEVDNGKLVWLVREVIALENKADIPLELRVTEEEMNAITTDELFKEYSDLTKALHSISATMDMVNVTITTLGRFKTDPKRYGTVDLAVFTDLVTEATETVLCKKDILYILIDTLKADFSQLVYLIGKTIVIDIVGLVDYLETIMLTAILNTEIKKPHTLTNFQQQLEDLIDA